MIWYNAIMIMIPPIPTREIMIIGYIMILKPPTCAVFSTIAAPFVLVFVPGQKNFKFNPVSVSSYLVLNFIPLRLAELMLVIIESPRVERVSLNPTTVST